MIISHGLVIGDGYGFRNGIRTIVIMVLVWTVPVEPLVLISAILTSAYWYVRESLLFNDFNPLRWLEDVTHKLNIPSILNVIVPSLINAVFIVFKYF